MFDIIKFLEHAPIKLVHGIGDPETGGCWMSAISVYSGSGWSDQPDCVDTVIRNLCVIANDNLLNDKLRGEVILPHLLEPVGTKTTDVTINLERLRALKLFYRHRFVPRCYEIMFPGNPMIERLRSPDWDSVWADFKTDDPKEAAFVSWIVHGTVVPHDVYCMRIRWLCPEDGCLVVQDTLIPFILELCRIGSKVPVEAKCSEESFKKVVQCRASSD